MTTLRIIAHARSELKDPAAAPKQGSEAAPEAWIEFAPEVGLRSLEAVDGTPVIDLKPVLDRRQEQ